MVILRILITHYSISAKDFNANLSGDGSYFRNALNASISADNFALFVNGDFFMAII